MMNKIWSIFSKTCTIHTLYTYFIPLFFATATPTFFLLSPFSNPWHTMWSCKCKSNTDVQFVCNTIFSWPNFSIQQQYSFLERRKEFRKKKFFLLLRVKWSFYCVLSSCKILLRIHTHTQRIFDFHLTFFPVFYVRYFRTGNNQMIFLRMMKKYGGNIVDIEKFRS